MAPYYARRTQPRQVVEELEDRLGDRMDQVLSAVSTSLRVPAESHEGAGAAVAVAPQVQIYQEDQRWEHDAAEDVYDDFGDGAGVEGDLDMDDDGE